MTTIDNSQFHSLDFDPSFCFRDDCGGKDPDIGSPTLRRYHRMLWSKRLPNGEVMQLTHDNGGYLKWKDFEFGSDAMGNGLFHKRADKSLKELKALLRDYDAFVNDFERRAWTIGGEIIFPRHDNSMNQLRGTNPYIRDRWDLTLECIRRFYRGEDSPLYEVLNRDRSFYELFVDFKGYVDFFFLQDCVSPDYSKVIFWQDDCSLTKTLPLPRTAEEHMVWLEKNLEFIGKRADRMKKALESESQYDDLSAGQMDDYYETIDEVLAMLRNDTSLDVSTKRLRATPYTNGYVRYVKINGFCCGILFDKANWEDPDTVSTPFWLSITDPDWNLSDHISECFSRQDRHHVAWKWQNKPCLALVPPADAQFHEICDNLVRQIVIAIEDIN